MWCGVVERHLEMSQATKNIFTTLKYYVLLTNIKRRTSDYTYFYSGEEFQPKKKKKSSNQTEPFTPNVLIVRGGQEICFNMNNCMQYLPK